jgi:hypothetical protein
MAETAPANASVVVRNNPCEQIRIACENAGFVPKKLKQGIGLSADCIVPIVKGIPQPANATKPLPTVDPQIAAACRARNPDYYSPKTESKPAPGDSSNP